MVIHYKDKEFFNGHDLTLSVDRRKLENSNYMDFVTPFTFKMK
ncbi:transcriptional regulator [Bacillus cereus AH1272]|nr:transcriptional regulator [Bacillus cereus AH1272]EEL90360.1 transcriptional regulator [Bacillus cereus AH1273]